jgi:hypothetical protein
MSKKTIISIVIFIAVGVWIFWSLKQTEEQQVFCTEEALLCPDGSGVGRQGPNCAFAACPNQESFTGELVQDSNGFRLIISAPDNSPQEVTYALPLTREVSNVTWGDFVGKRVVVQGLFTVGNTYSVATIGIAQNPDPTVGDIGVGETKLISGVKITFNKITQDSRCPLGVMCIQAGSVTANVTLKSDADTENVDLVAGAVPHAFDSFNVSLESVAPIRRQQETIDPNEYIGTFRVESL